MKRDNQKADADSKVRGEGLFFDDDEIFEITGEQIKLIHALSRQQGGNKKEQDGIRELLKIVVTKECRSIINNRFLIREVTSCMSCPIHGDPENCDRALQRMTDEERFEKCVNLFSPDRVIVRRKKNISTSDPTSG